MRSGFTIIELMTTLVILGILVTIAIPSFNDLIVGTRIKGAASDIYGALTFARSEAIKRNANVTVSPLSGQWVNGWQVMAGATVLATHGALNNLKVECPSGTACTQTFTYGRNGRLTAGTLTMSVDLASPPTPPRVPMRCINVDLSGRVNVTADNNRDGDCTNG
ncbi:MAG TPA: GspH/FimT family pseudopilin [Burkholderiales bacterium]|nr:GspH/FimT family pseudopilin [Burkholderiales bacterium]